MAAGLKASSKRQGSEPTLDCTYASKEKKKKKHHQGVRLGLQRFIFHKNEFILLLRGVQPLLGNALQDCEIEYLI